MIIWCFSPYVFSFMCANMGFSNTDLYDDDILNDFFKLSYDKSEPSSSLSILYKSISKYCISDMAKRSATLISSIIPFLSILSIANVKTLKNLTISLGVSNASIILSISRILFIIRSLEPVQLYSLKTLSNFSRNIFFNTVSFAGKRHSKLINFFRYTSGDVIPKRSIDRHRFFLSAATI